MNTARAMPAPKVTLTMDDERSARCGLTSVGKSRLVLTLSLICSTRRFKREAGVPKKGRD